MEIAYARTLTVDEAAALLRIHPKTAYRLALRGRLPGALRVGGHWRVSRARTRVQAQQGVLGGM
ncbi:MAG: helix-turn-helix domain-containing protein [Deltaproteobacteria bacterium]